VLLFIGVLAIIVDGAFIIIKRKAKEHLWFSISSFAYTCIMLITICYLKYDENFTLQKECYDEKTIDEYKKVKNFLMLVNDVCLRDQIFVPAFLITVIGARWAYPVQNEKLKKLSLSNLLILYVASGGELADFVSYVSESKIIHNKLSFYLIMGKQNFSDY
jgi:hypothetical protein